MGTLTDYMSALADTMIRPCPFCGGKGKLEKIERKTKSGDHEPYYKVQCYICKAQTYVFRFPEFAVSFWNQRTRK